MTYDLDTGQLDKLKIILLLIFCTVMSIENPSVFLVTDVIS